MSRGDSTSHPESYLLAPEHLGRELSARTVMFHEAVARRIGLSATEHKCLDLLLRSEKPLTAGQLAELTGLTTGAITGVLDRLERAGFVRREHSHTDRRQVLIHPQAPRQKEYNDILNKLGEVVAQVETDYSPEELVLIHGYLARMIEVMKEQTARLGVEPKKTQPSETTSKRRKKAQMA
jgi:DNA-binding MarR family transcriptional regulator